MLLEEPLVEALEAITVACDDPYKESCPQEAHWAGVMSCCGTVYLVCDPDKQRMQEALIAGGARVRHTLCMRKIDRLNWSPISGGSHDS